MAIKSTGLNLKGIKGEFFERFNAAEKLSFFNDLATRITSTSDSETYRWIGSVPPMREFNAQRVAVGLSKESYNVVNLKYENTIEVDRTEVEDDQLGQIRIRIQEMGQRAGEHKDILTEALIENGSTAGFNSYDGVPFFDAAHVSGKSGTQSNESTFDISVKTPNEPNTPDNASPASMRAAFGEVVAAMMQFKDDQGQLFRVSPTGLIIACHPNQFANWNQAINATVLNNNTNTPVAPAGALPRVLPIPGLTDISKFFVFRTNGVIRPFIFQDRVPMDVVDLEGGEGQFHTDKWFVGSRARYKIAYGQWRHAFAMDFV